MHVQVKAAGDGDDEPRSAIVMFIEGERRRRRLRRAAQEASNESVRRLAQELELTQARLRTVREESDAANEELRAANEELQSINEEYRSTSEELETSKEELQSINEELQTVNTELKLKLETISRAHSDLQNLMAATDFGTLFLDSEPAHQALHGSRDRAVQRHARRRGPADHRLRAPARLRRTSPRMRGPC